MTASFVKSCAESLITQEGFLSKKIVLPEVNLKTMPNIAINDFIWIQKRIELFLQNKELQEVFFSIPLPFQNPLAEELLKKTFSKPHIEHFELRRGILEAFLFPLRQIVGSCFATAFAIGIHEESPLFFLKDMKALFSKGSLERVIEGIGINAPLNIFFLDSQENDPYAAPQFLRVWDYTLASLSEAKPAKSLQMFFIALGIETNETNGFFGTLAEVCQELLEGFKNEIEEKAAHIEIEKGIFYALQRRFQNATEQEGRFLQAEYTRAKVLYEDLIEEYERKKRQADIIAELPNKIIDKMVEDFPYYFQEVFDPSLKNKSKAILIDDSPAGFRLLYKHGREHPKMWTLVSSEKEYKESLSSFLYSERIFWETEGDVKLVKNFLPQIFRSLEYLIQKKEFIEAAVARMRVQTAFKGMLILPWCYESGGSLRSLTKAYFPQKHFEEIKKTIENEEDLALFFLREFYSWHLISPIRKKNGGLIDSQLALSPTHAFRLILTSDAEDFIESKKLEFLWLRDNFLIPQKALIPTLLSAKDAHFLFKGFFLRYFGEQKNFPEVHFLKDYISLEELFKELLTAVEGYNIPIKYHIEPFLFWNIPLFSQEEASNLLKKEIKTPYMLPQDLIEEWAQLFWDNKSLSPIAFALKELRSLGVLKKRAFVFADTNWKEFPRFAWILHPLTKELSLVMSDEEGFFCRSFGIEKHSTWGVLKDNSYAHLISV